MRIKFTLIILIGLTACSHQQSRVIDETKYFRKNPRSENTPYVEENTFALSMQEKRKLAAMAIQGDGAAASRLALYYSIICGDRESALAWMHWAASLRDKNAKHNFEGLAEDFKD